jgi:hypothetical protein
MRTHVAAPLAFAAALVVSACAGERTPPLPLAPNASLAAAPTASTCDISRTRSDAKAYFASNSDPIYTIINDLSQAYKADPASSTTLNKGYDGLARIAVARVTSGVEKSTATATQRAVLALDFFGCMPTTAPAGADLQAALNVSSSAGGLFGVRGGATDPASAGLYSTGAPTWGVQLQSGNWPQYGARFLVYGWPTTSSGSIDQATPTGIELRTAPTVSFASNPVLVGVCDAQNSNVRIQHSTTVLTKQTFNCPTPLTLASRDRNGSGVTALLRAFGRLLAPSPAYAASMLVGGVGGLTGSFSPFTGIFADPVISFSGQPLDSYVTPAVVSGTNAHGYVEVYVRTAGGTPLANARVDLAVVGNNGSFSASGTTAYTDATGHAEFPTFTIDKAGGYTISASAVFDGLASAGVSANAFNVKNKTAP